MHVLSTAHPVYHRTNRIANGILLVALGNTPGVSSKLLQYTTQLSRSRNIKTWYAHGYPGFAWRYHKNLIHTPRQGASGRPEGIHPGTLGRFIIGNTVKYFDYVQDGAYLRVTWLDSSRSVWSISSNGEKLVSLHPAGHIWIKKDKTQEYLIEAKNYVISWLKQYKQNISSFDQRYRRARNKAELEAVEAAATKAFNEQSFTLYIKSWWRLIESNNEITQILDNLNKQTTQLMLTLESTKKIAIEH